MSLSDRVKRLEDLATPPAPEYADPEYAVAMNVQLIEGRGIPLPPYPPDLDVEATARLWTNKG